jgi:MFS family permease
VRTVTAAIFGLALVGALRGTWSPCGLSMLSTLTPMAERARRHSYWRSATWFLAGSALGGVTLGGFIALGSLLSRGAGIPSTARIAVAVAATAACLAADARLFGFRLPEHPRQVDSTWVTRFRPWAYASGYGWQLGTGVSTYVMTSATYAVILAGMVILPPVTALALGVAYGVCRGATILVGAPVTSPARLRSVHRWLAASDQASIAVAMAAQLAFLALGVVHLGTGVLVIGASCLLALLIACVLRLHALSATAPVTAS